MEVKVRAVDWSSVCHICLSTDRRTWGLDGSNAAYTALTGCVPLEDARVCFECRAELARFTRLRTRGQTAQLLIIAARLETSTEKVMGKCMSRLTVQHIYTYGVNFDSDIDFTLIPSDDDSQDFKVPITDTEYDECAPECEVWVEPGLGYDVTLIPVETADEKTSATKRPVQTPKRPPQNKAKNKLGLPELKVNEDCDNVAKDDMIEMFTPTEEQLANYRMNVLSGANNFEFICITCREGFEHKAEMMKHDEKYHSEAAGVHRCDICASRFPTPDELEQHRAAHYRMWRCMYTGCDFVHACRSTVSSHVAGALHVLGDKSTTKHQDKNLNDNYLLKDEPISVKCEVLLEMDSASDEASLTNAFEEPIPNAQPVQSRPSHIKSEPRKDPAEIRPGRKLKDGSVGVFTATDEQLASYRAYLNGRLKHSKSKCVTCLVEFRCGNNLKKHNETYHSEAAGAHRCDICASRFPSTGALEKHRAAHYRLWRCLYPGCSYVHTRKTTVTWHRLLHDKKSNDQTVSVDGPGVDDTKYGDVSHTTVLPGMGLSFDNNMVAAKTAAYETVGRSSNSLLEKNVTHDDRMEMFTITEEQLAAYRSNILKNSNQCRYICYTCLSRFSCKEKMKEHNEKYHSEAVGPQQCDICARRFPSLDELLSHRTEHYRLWRCLIAGCDYVHERKDTLALHLAHAPHKQPRESRFAGRREKSIVDKKDMRQPKKEAKPKRKRQASVEKFVATEENLKAFRAHMCENLKNPKTKKCMTCLTKFRSDDFLKKHIEDCHSEAAGAHLCDICECRLPSAEELAEHRARHYNMWRCSHPGCDYMHNLKNYVTRHNLQHNGSRKSKAKYRVEPMMGPFECDICGKVFDQRRKIFYHIKNHRKVYMCEVCGFRCATLPLLENHKRAHQDPSCRPYQCEQCNKRFIHRHQLKVHFRLHTGEQIFRCVVCYSKFVSDEALQRHIQNRHSEGKETVKNKLLEARTKSSFRNKKHPKSQMHRHRHSSKPKLDCNECGKSFKYPSQLHDHILFRHKGEKPHQCNVCGARFTQKAHVNIHMRSHSDEKPFKCDVCEASYKYLSSLWSHKLIHTALKQHQCTICGSRFTLKGNLAGHMKTHTNERPFECNLCEKKFLRKRNLNDHMKAHA